MSRPVACPVEASVEANIFAGHEQEICVAADRNDCGHVAGTVVVFVVVVVVVVAVAVAVAGGGGGGGGGGLKIYNATFQIKKRGTIVHPESCTNGPV